MEAVGFQIIDLSGMEYIAPRGKQKGNLMMVLGPDKDHLFEDRWLVKSHVTRHVWSVEGSKLRELLKEKIEHHWKRLQEIQQKKKQMNDVPAERKVMPEKKIGDKKQLEWMDYDIKEFVNAELVLLFYSKLLQDWMIIISHEGMYGSHGSEIRAEFEKHGGAVYTISELNDMIETNTGPQYLKNIHLLKKTFFLEYESKSK